MTPAERLQQLKKERYLAQLKEERAALVSQQNPSSQRANGSFDYGAAAANLVPLAQLGASFIPATRLPMAAINAGLGAYGGFYDNPEASLQDRLLQAGKKGAAEGAFSLINIPGMKGGGLKEILKRAGLSGAVAGGQDVVGQMISGKQYDPSETMVSAGLGAGMSGALSTVAPYAKKGYDTFKRFGKGIELSKMTESQLDDIALNAMNKADKSLQDKIGAERAARRGMQTGRSIDVETAGLNQFLDPQDQAKIAGWKNVKEQLPNFKGPAGPPEMSGINPQTGIPFTMMDLPNPSVKVTKQPDRVLDRFVGSQPTKQELDFQAFPKGADVNVKPLPEAFPASQMDVGQGPYILHGRFPAKPDPAQVWRDGQVKIPGAQYFEFQGPQQTPVPHYYESPTNKFTAPLNELEDIKDSVQGMFRFEKAKNLGKEAKITSPKEEELLKSKMGYLTGLQHSAGPDISASLEQSKKLHGLREMLDPMRSTQGSRLTIPSAQYAGSLQKIGSETGDNLYEMAKQFDIANSINRSNVPSGIPYVPMSKASTLGALMTYSPRVTQGAAGLSGLTADMLSRTSPLFLNQLFEPYQEENR